MNVHKIWLLLLFLLIPTILFAQKTRTVKGLVCTTSETKKGEEPLPYASLVILEGKDSTFVKGVASDADGRFNLQFTPQKGTQYLLKASYTGMQSVFRKLDSNASTINLGSILLEEGIELGEVTVNARMRDVDQVGDTTVINAAAYKTPEGSYLETLVKRIPGMEYDSETKTLKYNGLPINEINVNGEAFFSGDNKMALENLPVELISKIKVYDKKSKLEKLTGVSTGKENYVLDLQTKEEFNGTLLASGKAGYGNNNKKDFNLQGNYFKNNGNNFSVIANSGNLHMRTSYKDNIQENVAVNFTQKYNKKLTLNGNVSYHHNEQGNISTSYNEQYLTSGGVHVRLERRAAVGAAAAVQIERQQIRRHAAGNRVHVDPSIRSMILFLARKYVTFAHDSDLPKMSAMSRKLSSPSVRSKNTSLYCAPSSCTWR